MSMYTVLESSQWNAVGVSGFDHIFLLELSFNRLFKLPVENINNSDKNWGFSNIFNHFLL